MKTTQNTHKPHLSNKFEDRDDLYATGNHPVAWYEKQTNTHHLEPTITTIEVHLEDVNNANTPTRRRQVQTRNNINITNSKTVTSSPGHQQHHDNTKKKQHHNNITTTSQQYRLTSIRHEKVHSDDAIITHHPPPHNPLAASPVQESPCHPSVNLHPSIHHALVRRVPSSLGAHFWGSPPRSIRRVARPSPPRKSAVLVGPVPPSGPTEAASTDSVPSVPTSQASVRNTP